MPPSLCSVVFVNDDQAEVERAALHRVLVTTAATSGALNRLNLRPGLWLPSTHVVTEHLKILKIWSGKIYTALILAEFFRICGIWRQGSVFCRHLAK